MIYKIVYVDSKKIAKRKKKVVINIRELNKIIVSNNYSISLQKNIVIVIQKCIFINVVDYNEQFHLFLIKKNYRQRFIIVFYKGFEHFNITTIKFKNSVSYVQKKMNEFLYSYRHFARCYIDNIIIFSRSAKEYFQHLKTIFALFARFKIILKSKKSYLNYLSIILFK